MICDAVLNHNKLQVISYQMSCQTLKIHVWKYNYNAKQKTAETFFSTYYMKHMLELNGNK
jgi:hypothetical protein